MVKKKRKIINQIGLCVCVCCVRRWGREGVGVADRVHTSRTSVKCINEKININMKETLVLRPQSAYNFHILQRTDELETRRIKASSTQH